MTRTRILTTVGIIYLTLAILVPLISLVGRPASAAGPALGVTPTPSPQATDTPPPTDTPKPSKPKPSASPTPTPVAETLPETGFGDLSLSLMAVLVLGGVLLLVRRMRLAGR